MFQKLLRSITEPGKGSYWALDISNGEGYKRERKRRAKGARHPPTKQQHMQDDDDDASDDAESSSNAGSPSLEEMAAGPSTARTRRSASATRRPSPYPVQLHPSSSLPSSSTLTMTRNTLSLNSPTDARMQNRQGQSGYSSFVERPSGLAPPNSLMSQHSAFGTTLLGQQDYLARNLRPLAMPTGYLPMPGVYSPIDAPQGHGFGGSSQSRHPMTDAGLFGGGLAASPQNSDYMGSSPAMENQGGLEYLDLGSHVEGGESSNMGKGQKRSQ